MSPFIRQELPTPPPAGNDKKPPRVLRPAVSQSCISTGKELFQLAAKICHHHNLHVVIDSIIMLLADFAGLAKVYLRCSMSFLNLRIFVFFGIG
jgi:hypothetical protein